MLDSKLQLQIINLFATIAAVLNCSVYIFLEALYLAMLFSTSKGERTKVWQGEVVF